MSYKTYTKNCIICTKEFTVYRNYEPKTCSYKCSGLYKTGEKNGFYGRKHTKESLAKISKANKAGELARNWQGGIDSLPGRRAFVKNLNAKRKKSAKGDFTWNDWELLKSKFNNRCLCCRKTTKLTQDHIVPLSKGGTNYISNIQPLCLRCNVKKMCKSIDYRFSEKTSLLEI